jgi:HEAT repeat protein
VPTSPVPTQTGRSGWESWWTLNRHRFLRFVARRDLRRRAERSGPASHFFGKAGAGNVVPDEDRGARRTILDALLVAARHEDRHISTSAVIALGKSGDHRAVQTLRDLGAPRTKLLDVRESALLALGLLGSGGREVRAELQTAVAGRGRKTSESAFAALGLGFLGDAGALPGLAKATRAGGGRRDVPALAVISLGLIGDEIVVPDLVRGLSGGRRTGKRDDVIRACAVAALGKLGSRAAIPALLRALADRDKDVRRQAVLSLGAASTANDANVVSGLLLLARRDRDSLTRGYAALTLGEIGAVTAKDVMLRMFERGDSTESPYATLGLSLLASSGGDGGLRDRILARLRQELDREKNPARRSAIAVGLGLAQDTSAIASLIGVLSREKLRSVRGHAAVSLGLLGARDALPVLRDALTERGDPGFRREVALGIGLMGDPESVRLLTRIMRTGSTEYDRGSAALALGCVATVRTAGPLVETLRDTSAADTTRALAAASLGLVLESGQVPVLTRLGDRLNPHIAVATLTRALGIE